MGLPLFNVYVTGGMDLLGKTILPVRLRRVRYMKDLQTELLTYLLTDRHTDLLTYRQTYRQTK